jgi:hypothetical protein
MLFTTETDKTHAPSTTETDETHALYYRESLLHRRLQSISGALIED